MAAASSEILNSKGPPPAILVELGWRLRHWIAAREHDLPVIAAAASIELFDLELTLSGHHDLPISVVDRVLDAIDATWWDLFGADVPRLVRVHHLTLDSESWHAIESGVQSYDIRRDVEQFRVGDLLHLHEKLEDRATGRTLNAEVTHMLYLASVGLPAGYVALTLRLA